MKVLELFSGIGGMHFALSTGRLDQLEVIAAVDINPIANEVYQHNFPSTKLLQKNIQSLTVNEINQMSPEVILMSPPCQPFTRNGLRKDVDDERSNPLKHFISVFPNLKTVQYLLLENVKGFETSKARDVLINCLKESNFNYQEFILSPNQFGVCNTRHRYYLLAKKNMFSFPTSQMLMTNFPERAHLDKKIDGSSFSEKDTIHDIIETFDETSELYKSHLIPLKSLAKNIFALDIVTLNCKRSCCFTKAYSHYLKGTGSVFSNLDLDQIKHTLEECRNCDNDTLNKYLQSLNLRYFTPVEISRLMCFPKDSFTFPSTVTTRKKYRLLGNSINVFVVSKLISLLVDDK